MGRTLSAAQKAYLNFVRGERLCRGWEDLTWQERETLEELRMFETIEFHVTRYLEDAYWKEVTK